MVKLSPSNFSLSRIFIHSSPVQRTDVVIILIDERISPSLQLTHAGTITSLTGLIELPVYISSVVRHVDHARLRRHVAGM